MDDEDLQDIKDSRNIVDTTEEMDFLGGTQAELRGTADADDSDKEYVLSFHNCHGILRLNELLPAQYHAH